MKLVASLIVAEVERGRYLGPCLDHLLEFCDQIVVLWDGEVGVGWDTPRLHFYGADRPFFEHEGRARQQLLDLTLSHDPTHVLAIDADEFVADGALLRYKIEYDRYAQAWTTCMAEVWHADQDELRTREDGGWQQHDVLTVWKAADAGDGLRIADAALACGRVPENAMRWRRGCLPTATLHFGWANPAERIERHARYAEHDGGRFHASAHLDSILWPDDRITLQPADWPDALLPHRDAILSRIVRS